MPLGHRDAGLGLGEAIPDVLDELQALLGGEVEDLLKEGRGGYNWKLCLFRPADKGAAAGITCASAADASIRRSGGAAARPLVGR